MGRKNRKIYQQMCSHTPRQRPHNAVFGTRIVTDYAKNKKFEEPKNQNIGRIFLQKLYESPTHSKAIFLQMFKSFSRGDFYRSPKTVPRKIHRTRNDHNPITT